jgi:hypothetical protein
MVLTEATRYLFAELGRRLEFWRNKKGEIAPKKVELKPDPVAPVIKLDDLEQFINLNSLNRLSGSIENSLDMLQKLTRTLDDYRNQLDTDTMITAKERAYLKNEIPNLKKKIEKETMLLESFLAQVYQD